jgi:2-polyprenyl-6-hydroxyphenyl methylase/3-demethylubiquinone-9 3-methyltransferase
MDLREENRMAKLAGNVDRKEISKFEALAASWWDPDGSSKPLHDINPLRLGYIAARCPLAGKRVLDVGCGGGILAEAMAKAGAVVTGIDMGREPLEVARAHQVASGLGIDYRQGTPERFAKEAPEPFDAVVCLEMLEHVPSPPSVIDACRRLVKPGGDLFFATLNRNPKSFLFAIIGAEYLLRLLPVGTHRYSRFIRPAELCAWAQKAGLAVCDITGMHYNPFTRRYRLGGNRHVNYLAHLRRPAPVGCRL